MSTRGMVVSAGSGARQFHIKRSVALGRRIDIAVWITGEIFKCKVCHGECWAIDERSIPPDDLREWREDNSTQIPVACQNCNGNFIE